MPSEVYAIYAVDRAELSGIDGTTALVAHREPLEAWQAELRRSRW
jgi:hypothetical protein